VAVLSLLAPLLPPPGTAKAKDEKIAIAVSPPVNAENCLYNMCAFPFAIYAKQT
jgi:hypothetical protein